MKTLEEKYCSCLRTSKNYRVLKILWAAALTGCLALTASGTGLALQRRPENHPQPQPDLQNVRYGSYEHNLMDFWQAESDRPTPLVVIIHGGGFRVGDKNPAPYPLPEKCLAAGFLVASINYRLSDVAVFPAQMLGGARAIQFLLSKATNGTLIGPR